MGALAADADNDIAQTPSALSMLTAESFIANLI
jgi:hypothetical protein